jgi:hypothetical protein
MAAADIAFLRWKETDILVEYTAPAILNSQSDAMLDLDNLHKRFEFLLPLPQRAGQITAPSGAAINA